MRGAEIRSFEGEKGKLVHANLNLNILMCNLFKEVLLALFSLSLICFASFHSMVGHFVFISSCRVCVCVYRCVTHLYKCQIFGNILKNQTNEGRCSVIVWV